MANVKDTIQVVIQNHKNYYISWCGRLFVKAGQPQKISPLEKAQNKIKHSDIETYTPFRIAFGYKSKCKYTLVT